MDNGRRGTRRVVTTIGIALAAALVWVVVSTLLLWRNQERVVFQPPGTATIAPGSATRVSYEAADGNPLFGYVVGPPRREGSSNAVVIAFHGNADLAAWLVPWGRELADRTGATVFLPEYRGYAEIAGTPTYANASSDALGALRYARAAFPASRVVLFGHSLGTAIATEVAQAHPGDVGALVLQAPFTSARDMAARMLVPPWEWLWRRISRVPYDTRTRVRALDMPVWVAHGTRDVVIPSYMGRAVHDAAKRRGEMLVVDGAGHNDVADVGGENYWRWLSAAVASAVVGELEEKSHRRLP